ncbi:unnamed protein product, partial [Amoebophrya sp. A120]|eukprot:GSA120T00021636001.1
MDCSQSSTVSSCAFADDGQKQKSGQQSAFMSYQGQYFVPGTNYVESNMHVPYGEAHSYLQGDNGYNAATNYYDGTSYNYLYASSISDLHPHFQPATYVNEPWTTTTIVPQGEEAKVDHAWTTTTSTNFQNQMREEQGAFRSIIPRQETSSPAGAKNFPKLQEGGSSSSSCRNYTSPQKQFLEVDSALVLRDGLALPAATGSSQGVTGPTDGSVVGGEDDRAEVLPTETHEKTGRVEPPKFLPEREQEIHLVHFRKTYAVMGEIVQRTLLFRKLRKTAKREGALLSNTPQDITEATEVAGKTEESSNSSSVVRPDLSFYDFGAAPGGFCAQLLSHTAEVGRGYGISLPPSEGGYHMVYHDPRLKILPANIFDIEDSSKLTNLHDVCSNGNDETKSKTRASAASPQTELELQQEQLESVHSPKRPPSESTGQVPPEVVQPSTTQHDAFALDVEQEPPLHGQQQEEHQAQDHRRPFPALARSQFLVNLINCDMQDLAMQRDQTQ